MRFFRKIVVLEILQNNIKNTHRSYMKSELGDFLYSRYLKNYNGFKKTVVTFLRYTKDYLLATKN